jgi:hypothetical protein
MKDIRKIGDIFAVPFFALIIYYFYNKKNKTKIEIILLLFGISGFLIDILFTILWIYFEF